MLKKHPVLFVLIALFLAYIINIFIKAGIFKHIENKHENFSIETLASPPGVEDIAYDPETETIFLSSHNRRNRDTVGAIYVLSPKKGLINLTEPLGLKEFRPHGISFLKVDSSTKFLFVISHKNDKDVVLKFRFDNDSLQLTNTFSSTYFQSLNDLQAVGSNSFYASNDHGKVKGWKKKISDIFRIPIGNLVYFDGANGKIVVKKLAYPNGIIAMNGQLYVASTLGNRMKVFEAADANGNLKEVENFKTPTGFDNLTVFGSTIYAVAHPKLLAFTKHAKSANELSPFTIYSIANNEVTELFTDNGQLLSGSSIAQPIIDSLGNKQFYIGSIFESKILKLSQSTK